MGIKEWLASVIDVANVLDLDGQFKNQITKPLFDGYCRVMVRNSDYNHAAIELHFDAVVLANIGDEKSWKASDGRLAQCLTANVCIFTYDWLTLSPKDQRLGLQLAFNEAMKNLHLTNLCSTDDTTAYELHSLIKKFREDHDQPAIAFRRLL